MYSYYRGAVFTNSTLKGPFTEARDILPGTVFELLKRCAEKKAGLDVQIIRDTPDGDIVAFQVSDLNILISENGRFEICGGGA